MAEWLCEICRHETKQENIPDACENCSADYRSIISKDDNSVSKFIGFPDNLEDVRNRARVKLKGICAVYPACDGKPDRVCQKEAYGKPIGLGGAGAGVSFAENFASLERLRLKMRVVGEHFEPDTRTEIFGRKLSIPVLGAPTSGMEKYNDSIREIDFCRASIRGCAEAGSLSMRGDTWYYTPENNPALDALEIEGGNGIPFFKPRSQDILKKLIERAEQAGCPAVGVDLDGCGSTNMARHGQPVFRKSVKDIRELVGFSSLPFIAKGIMTTEDAEDCVSAGVKAVAVSNHGGRVLDSTPGVAEVLPEIADKVGKYVHIFSDGGVRTGYDAIKMIALGADFVLIGRDLIRAAMGGGTEGVRLQMERIKATLRQAMMMTRCRNIDSISSKIFYK